MDAVDRSARTNNDQRVDGTRAQIRECAFAPLATLRERRTGIEGMLDFDIGEYSAFHRQLKHTNVAKLSDSVERG